MATIHTELEEVETESRNGAATDDPAPATPARKLSRRDSIRFVESIENPPPPGERLKRGADNFKQRYQ